MFILLIIVIYLYYTNVVKHSVRPQHVLNYTGASGPYQSIHAATTIKPDTPTVIVVSAPPIADITLAGIASRQDPMENPYIPPVNISGMYFPEDSGSLRGVPGLPVNVPTRGRPENYSQVGVLTRDKKGHGGDMVLPLMGRQSMGGRSQYQYYTMLPSGNLNTKLPVRVNGKSCTSEYGCNEISNGDPVYVEGLNDTFRVTMYDRGVFSYIPYL